MARNPYTIPRNDELVGESRRITRPWLEFISALAQGNAAASQSITSVDLTGQAASIATTALPIQSVTDGLYRVSAYFRVTTAAGSSSSITPTISWTESGVSLSLNWNAITGNTVTSVRTARFTILVDGGTPISYSTTYASSGSPAMQYRLFLLVERLDS